MGSVQTMKAARYDPKVNKIGLHSMPIPRHSDNEILIKTVAASICHSDLMLIDGSSQTGPSETISIGHEATGEVIALGSKVTGFKIGDHIGFVNAYGACFNCEGCKCHYVYCSGGKMTMQGFTIDGFFQEYCTIDPNTAIVLPKGLDASKAAPLFCAGITAYNGVKAARLHAGQWLVIIGCGGLGQLAIRYGKALGLKVIAIDVDDTVLALATEASVDAAYNSRTNANCLSDISKITGGGADAVIVFTAVKAGYDLAPRTLKVGGNLVCVGCPPKEVSFNAMEIAFQRYHVYGANNSANPEELQGFAAFTVKHGIESPQKVFGIEDINVMIDTMEKHKMGGTRLVVKF